MNQIDRDSALQIIEELAKNPTDEAVLNASNELGLNEYAVRKLLEAYLQAYQQASSEKNKPVLFGTELARVIRRESQKSLPSGEQLANRQFFVGDKEDQKQEPLFVGSGSAIPMGGEIDVEDVFEGSVQLPAGKEEVTAAPRGIAIINWIKVDPARHGGAMALLAAGVLVCLYLLAGSFGGAPSVIVSENISIGNNTTATIPAVSVAMNNSTQVVSVAKNNSTNISMPMFGGVSFPTEEPKVEKKTPSVVYQKKAEPVKAKKAFPIASASKVEPEKEEKKTSSPVKAPAVEQKNNTSSTVSQVQAKAKTAPVPKEPVKVQVSAGVDSGKPVEIHEGARKQMTPAELILSKESPDRIQNLDYSRDEFIDSHGNTVNYRVTMTDGSVADVPAEDCRPDGNGGVICTPTTEIREYTSVVRYE